MLRSLKAIRKEATVVAMILGRTSPDPRFGSPVELSGRDASGLLKLIRVGKTLSSQSIAAEKAPPALLQVEPAGALGMKACQMRRWSSSRAPGALAVVAGTAIVTGYLPLLHYQ